MALPCSRIIPTDEINIANIKWIWHIGLRVLEWWKEPTKLLERHFQNGSETDYSRMDLLLAALLKLRVTPHSHGYSPYEIVHGRPSIVRWCWQIEQGKGDGFSQQIITG